MLGNRMKPSQKRKRTVRKSREERRALFKKHPDIMVQITN